MTKPETVDAYIAEFPLDVQDVLKQIRAIIREKAPEAAENISYGMPAYKLHKLPLVYFAAFKHHIGFYATPTGHAAFEEALAKYKQGKGSVQFPLDKSIPFDLIGKMVAFRVQENTERAKKK